VRNVNSNREVQRIISANALLSLLSPAEQDQLAVTARLQHFAKGETFYEEYKAATDVWVLVSGQVKLVKFSDRGHVLALELMIPPEIFGAIFFTNYPFYPCTAIALQDAVALKFRVAEFHLFLEKNVRLQKATLAYTCMRLCHGQNMRGLAMEDVATRIGYVLIYLHGKFGEHIPHSRATLAELAGTTVETAIRVTRSLDGQGIIATKRGGITVLSLERLHEFAYKTRHR
jgi:CRP-like cAMP-binding protein